MVGANKYIKPTNSEIEELQNLIKEKLNKIEESKAMIKKYGDSKTNIELIGIRPGEKMHEVLVSSVEVNKTYELNNNYFVIVPDYGEEGFSDIKTKYNLTKQWSYMISQQ